MSATVASAKRRRCHPLAATWPCPFSAGVSSQHTLRNELAVALEQEADPAKVDDINRRLTENEDKITYASSDASMACQKWVDD
jgi:hypothetical protein